MESSITQRITAVRKMTPTPSIIPFTRTSTLRPTMTKKPTVTPSITPTINWATKLVPEEYRDLIYKSIPPFPEGFSGREGWSILSSGFPVHWEVFLVSFDKDQIALLNRKEMIRENEERWIISDVLLLPQISSENERLVSNWCTLNGVLDGEIFVIAELDKNDRYAENSSIQRAWRANRETGSFEELPVDGIECTAD